MTWPPGHWLWRLPHCQHCPAHIEQRWMDPSTHASTHPATHALMQSHSYLPPPPPPCPAQWSLLLRPRTLWSLPLAAAAAARRMVAAPPSLWQAAARMAGPQAHGGTRGRMATSGTSSHSTSATLGWMETKRCARGGEGGAYCCAGRQAFLGLLVSAVHASGGARHRAVCV